MNRRELLLGSGVALTTSLAGCSSDETDSEGGNSDGDKTDNGSSLTTSSSNETDNDSESSDSQEANTENEENVDISDSAPYSISGSGPTEINSVSVKQGFILVEASHTGTDAFQVNLEKMLVDETGKYEGETGGLVNEGEYTLNIRADGDWEISLRQPRPDSGSPLPQTLSGEGNSVHGPFEFDGQCGATATHSGDGEFVVILSPKKGWAEPIFSEQGEYEGSTTVNKRALHWVAIQADGEWTVELQN